MNMKPVRLLVLLILPLLAAGSLSAQLKVHHLITENKHEPVGIGEQKPRFSWQSLSDKKGARQTAYELQVMQGKKLLWSTGKVNSDQSLYIVYAGPALQSSTRYQWQVRVWDEDAKASAWSLPASFVTGMLDPAGWKAKWIEASFAEDPQQRPAQYFRTGFNLIKKITSALIYLTAHGMYEAKLNGKRIGDAYLAPGWTSYATRLQYQVYDVKDLLQQGSNALGMVAGNGWYKGYLAWGDNKDIYGKKLGVFAQLEITYTDGSKETIVTDEKWKCSQGSITFAEIYHGESIDARKELAGWTTASYNDAGWSPVKTGEQKLDNLIATFNEPVRKHETFKPVKIFKTPRGEQVMDFGQNLVGWVIVNAQGQAGDQITLKHAEVLDKEGNFYTENLRAAKATATYTLAGTGKETFEPHFTFYGFRYIKVEGYPGELKPENFTAVALYSDMEATGTFTSSHPLINQLQHNIQWGQRGNFLDVPTDCPQRDERLGWTGDAQAFSRTAVFNFDAHSFFTKWLRDVEADQLPTGSVPFVVPNVLGPGAAGSTGWADVANIIPWNMYLAYGDKQILSTQYKSMKNWVSYMEKNSKNDLWNTGFHFGDWLFYRPFDDNDGSSAVTDKYLIAQCFYAHSTQLLINSAAVLGNNDDVLYYNKLLKRIKDAFLKEYVTGSGRLVSGTQTAYVLALNFDMLPESMRTEAANRLVDNIKRYGNHLTTGFLGTPYLCHVLSRFGHLDMAYTLLLQESYPSWLYPVKMGATTIWERWNGIRTDGTFEPASMNSFNHYAYGAIGDWMYRVVAGLDTDDEGAGYKRIRIKPHIGEGLTKAEASLMTPYGQAASKWNVDKGTLTFTVIIPVNTEAVVYVPAAAGSEIREDGQLVSGVTIKDGYAEMKRGSGTYVFTVNTNK